MFDLVEKMKPEMNKNTLDNIKGGIFWWKVEDKREKMASKGEI